MHRTDGYRVYGWLPADRHEVGKGSAVNRNEGQHRGVGRSYQQGGCRITPKSVAMPVCLLALLLVEWPSKSYTSLCWEHSSSRPAAGYRLWRDLPGISLMSVARRNRIRNLAANVGCFWVSEIRHNGKTAGAKIRMRIAHAAGQRSQTGGLIYP